MTGSKFYLPCWCSQPCPASTSVLSLVYQFCSSAIHHICRGRRGHCPWSKNVHVEQFCSTWNFSEVMWNNITSHDNHSCSTWQNHLSCGVILACGSMTNCSLWQILIHLTNLQCTHAVLSWFMLFWCKIYFVAIYTLLCGAKNNQQILSVEHKWQIWCMGTIPKFGQNSQIWPEFPIWDSEIMTP